MVREFQLLWPQLTTVAKQTGFLLIGGFTILQGSLCVELFNYYSIHVKKCKKCYFNEETHENTYNV